LFSVFSFFCVIQQLVQPLFVKVKSSVLMVKYSTVQYMEVFGCTMMISPRLPRMEIKEDR
jgi:hypothetical protein